jgi:hypothetical protein
MAIFRNAMIGAAAVGVLATGGAKAEDFYGKTSVNVSGKNVTQYVHCEDTRATLVSEEQSGGSSSVLVLANFPPAPLAAGEKQMNVALAAQVGSEYGFVTGFQVATVGREANGTPSLGVQWKGPAETYSTVSGIENLKALKLNCQQNVPGNILDAADSLAQSLYQFCGTRKAGITARFLSAMTVQPSNKDEFEAKSSRPAFYLGKSIETCSPKPQ